MHIYRNLSYYEKMHLKTVKKRILLVEHIHILILKNIFHYLFCFHILKNLDKSAEVISTTKTQILWGKPKKLAVRKLNLISFLHFGFWNMKVSHFQDFVHSIKNFDESWDSHMKKLFLLF